MKLKPIYRYLGAGDFDLNDRANARCPSCCPPELPTAIHSITTGILTAVSPTSRRQPEAIKINNNMFFLMYTNPSLSTLYYRIVTVNPDFTVALTAEATIVTGTNVTHFHGTYLQDNKIIIAYVANPPSATTFKGRIVNFSGTTPTFNATVDLNTEATGGLPSAPCRMGRLTSGKALLIFVNADNLKQTAQVIDIDGSDNITFGLTYKEATLNCTHPRIAIINSSSAIIGTATSGVNVQGRFTSLSIAGTVATWGTPLSISNATQLPGSTSRQLFFADVASGPTGTTYGIGGSAVDSVRSHLIMPVTYGVPTTTVDLALQDTTTTYASDPTSTRAAIINRGNHIIAAVDAFPVGGGVSLDLRQYTTASPPTLLNVVNIEPASPSASIDDPELLYLSGRTSVLVYHASTGDLIKCYPFQSA